ncbi:GFA family protein [Pseudooceanicola sp. C21-150M6]|uniref:GFA family protein n=1 Tax=Pseudooceanicola sp. C21-150M6 TaxID=3434355 RepID=UPI003D7F4537
MSDWIDRPASHGMCQCGAARYSIAAGPVRDTLCGCRMCQRATGNFVVAFREVEETRVSWIEAPQVWRSSDVAERGFCASCGTPLFFRETNGSTIELLAATLGEGTPYTPSHMVRGEHLPAWSLAMGALPRRPAEGSPPSASRQAPEV